VSWQVGILFDVVLLVGVESWNEKCPQRLLGRRVKQRVHLSHELCYVPEQSLTNITHSQQLENGDF